MHRFDVRLSDRERTTFAIRREQRQAIHRELTSELSRIGDIWLALCDGRFEDARRLRCRFELIMRLLDDLGWSRDDPAEVFEITMPDRELRDVLRYLAGRTANTMASVGRDAAPDEFERGRATFATCADVLNALAAPTATATVVPGGRVAET
jgi:hypothetical protein